MIRRRNASMITAAAVDAFKAGDDGALREALRLAPWEVSPLDVDDGPCPWPPGCAGAASWEPAKALREALAQAIAPTRVYGPRAA